MLAEWTGEIIPLDKNLKIQLVGSLLMKFLEKSRYHKCYQ